MLRRLTPRFTRVLRASYASAAKSVPVETEQTEVVSTPTPQAPNYPSTWSASQKPRPGPQSGPRFEQTSMELQPNPLSAMEMVNSEPIRVVHGRKAVCDGGIGPLGHPKIFINLDQPGPHPCGYCGLRFEQAPHSGHDH